MDIPGIESVAAIDVLRQRSTELQPPTRVDDKALIAEAHQLGISPLPRPNALNDQWRRHIKEQIGKAVLPVAAKRLSGGRRRTLRKQGKPAGKPGRPKGRVNLHTRELLANLRRDLAWLAEPRLPDSELSRNLLNPKESTLDLIQILVNYEPKYLHFYKHIGGRAFRRHVATIQKEIWPYRDVVPKRRR